jgi:hypothetical protein
MGLFSAKPTTSPLAQVVPLLRSDNGGSPAATRDLDGQRPVYISLGRGWGVSFAEDASGAEPMITRADAMAAGLDETSLLRAATERLAAIARTELRASGERTYRLELPGHENLAASLILIMPLLLPSLPISGQPVISIGHRAQLDVCGSDDAESVAQLRELSTSLYGGGDATPVTPDLYTLVEGIITAYE